MFNRFVGCASWVILWSGLVQIGLNSARADLLVLGFNTNLHDRFSNSPTFIGSAYDWSGVGRASSGTWATMISPNYFLSATHSHPGINDSITFYGTNSLAGPSQTVNVVGGSQIGNTDLWLGRIDSPTQFTTYSLGGGNSTPYLNSLIYLFGVASGFPNAGAMRMGRNEIDQFLDEFSDPALGATVTDSIIYDYDTVNGLGADESLVFGGDSGAPAFMIYDNRPLLVGIHWFKYTSNEFGQPQEGSGDSFVPSYVSQIQSAMVGQNLSVVSVPEPSSLLLLSLSIGAGCAFQRRKKSPAHFG